MPASVFAAGTSLTIEDSKTTGTVTAIGGFHGVGIGGSRASSGGTSLAAPSTPPAADPTGNVGSERMPG